MAFDWSKLQNGSDIRGVALNGVEGEAVNLTATVVQTLGCAFTQWLINKGYESPCIAIGMDSRLSGNDLKQAFGKGINSMGAKVIDCGIASTPAMFMATINDKISAQAGVMLTASHLPFNRNGLKFFTSDGGLNKADISEILDLAKEGAFQIASVVGSNESFDFISEYSNGLVELIRKSVSSKENYNQPLAGTKIVVDAGNGAGGFFADKVLEVLGADTKGSQFLDPDGRFPNHIPNPEDSDAMNSICEAVKTNKADLGIIFDTDVDRSAIVNEKSEPINRNALIALIASVVLEEHPASTVVTDSITSKGLASFIAEKGGKHHRFKRGYKNVINESVRLNKTGEESWLAIETSGHAALKENYFLDDGAYLVAKLLIKMAQLKNNNQKLSDLIINLKHPLESEEYRLSINSDDFGSYGNKVISDLGSMIATVEGWITEPVNHEGIRVNCNNVDEKGWFLLRLSLHDPVMPLNIESDLNCGADIIKNKIKPLLQSFTALNAKDVL